MSLICENIVKTYSGKEVLQQVSLELQPQAALLFP